MSFKERVIDFCRKPYVAIFAVLLGVPVVFAYPIAMAHLTGDKVYLYIGVGAWLLLAMGFHSIYLRFKHLRRNDETGHTGIS